MGWTRSPGCNEANVMDAARPKVDMEGNRAVSSLLRAENASCVVRGCLVFARARLGLCVIVVQGSWSSVGSTWCNRPSQGDRGLRQKQAGLAAAIGSQRPGQRSGVGNRVRSRAASSRRLDDGPHQTPLDLDGDGQSIGLLEGEQGESFQVSNFQRHAPPVFKPIYWARRVGLCW
jgi:hypothetical protein